jgi:hypothetical protein
MSKNTLSTEPKLGTVAIAKRYEKPETRDGQPHTNFDYSNLTGDEFMGYCKILEGDVTEFVENSIAKRNGQGLLLLNKEYHFDLYMVEPIRMRVNNYDPKSTIIVAGIQMKDGKAIRKNMKMTLRSAILLNSNLPAGTSQVHCEYFLLSQEHDILPVAEKLDEPKKPRKNKNDKDTQLTNENETE